jgi:hypothetical protein
MIQQQGTVVTALNAECSYAVAAEARIRQPKEIWRRNAACRKACAMDSSYLFCVDTMAVGYHMNNQLEDLDRLIASKFSDSSVNSYLDYVKQIMSGKAKFN